MSANVALPGGPPLLAYLCRRRAVALCGPWNLKTRINQDAEYFLRMAARGARFAYFPSITGLYRVHDRSRISQGNFETRIEDTLSFLLAIEAELESSRLLTSRRRAAFAAAYRRLSWWSFNRNKRLWRRTYRESLRACPELPAGRPTYCYLQKVVGSWATEVLRCIVADLRRRCRETWLFRRRSALFAPNDVGVIARTKSLS